MTACEQSSGPAIGERSGELIYQTYCFACHDSGAVGAAKFGNQEQINLLRSKGIAALMQTTREGRGAMPRKGTCNDCTEEELQRTVEYLLGSVAKIEAGQ